MDFWVGVTNNEWFNFLSNQHLDEVNFWQPSAKSLFSSADLTGMPFLFKLKSPNNHIAGGGFYVGYSTMPIDLAWDTFGIANGAPNLQEFIRIIDPTGEKTRIGSHIGCTILSNPFFWSKEWWIANPINFGKSIVRGKSYSFSQPDGKMLWAEVQRRPVNQLNFLDLCNEINFQKDRFGIPQLIKPRLGQGSFRMMLTKVYDGRCAMTGENTLEVLEAAHILPYADEASTHDIDNGLLLRADFHKLFDKGLVSVTPDYEIRISPKIHEMYFNGKSYYRLDKKPLTVLPADPKMQPNKDKLDYHFRTIFKNY